MVLFKEQSRVVWAPIRRCPGGAGPLYDTSMIKGTAPSFYRDLSEEPIIGIAEVEQRRRTSFGRWKSSEVLREILLHDDGKDITINLLA